MNYSELVNCWNKKATKNQTWDEKDEKSKVEYAFLMGYAQCIKQTQIKTKPGTTKLHNSKIKKEIAAFWRAEYPKSKEKIEIRHIHPAAYVIGRATPSCLVVAVNWSNSEPQCKSWDQEYPLKSIHLFSPELKPGMWCAVAYVATNSSGELIAIPFVT